MEGQVNHSCFTWFTQDRYLHTECSLGPRKTYLLQIWKLRFKPLPIKHLYTVQEFKWKMRRHQVQSLVIRALIWESWVWIPAPNHSTAGFWNKASYILVKDKCKRTATTRVFSTGWHPWSTFTGWHPINKASQWEHLLWEFCFSASWVLAEATTLTCIIVVAQTSTCVRQLLTRTFLDHIPTVCVFISRPSLLGSLIRKPPMKLYSGFYFSSHRTILGPWL